MMQHSAGKSVEMIVACTAQGGIGKDGQLPWKLAGDMAYFKRVTLDTGDAPDAACARQNAVVMGRKTWDSIPAKFRPLAGRVNVVLSRSPASLQLPEGVLAASSLPAALSSLDARADVARCFIIGGAAVYAEALQMPRLSKVHRTLVHGVLDGDASVHRTFVHGVFECDAFVHRTLVHGVFECDAFVPATLPAHLTLDPPAEASPIKEEKDIKYEIQTKHANAIKEEKEIKYEIQTFSRATPSGGGNQEHEEHQYLNLIRDIMATGVRKGDRTGTGTISKFGCSLRFNLRESFPLLTTKRVFWRGVAEELLWFVSGATNANLLRDKDTTIWDGNGSTEDKDIHIWDGNGSKEFLSKMGLGHREEGDLGPVYGFQWRHFGAKYTDMHADYAGQGVDQLAQVIDTIKNNPNDRRILLSAWNPADLGVMALPPCHMFCQFYVETGKKELSCQMYQVGSRSSLLV
ncbi:thymidylate synthase-domain-containing protein [Baffinella frigidus]|nr:thymidylate synthase-domain-containing protein [Cryptophyta sp. CCMP2293]